ncbi:esterase [Klebsiella pneumoniae]|nr:esterase [Klebsiella pneumoniae]
MLVIHGMADGVIPVQESESAAQRLRDHGVAVDSQFEPGVGHTISAQGAQKAAAFIAARLA